MHLKLIANETKQELPGILAQISALNATEASAHNFMELDALDENDCPGFVLPYGDEDAGKKGTRIRVFDMDTFDAALLLDPNYKVYTHLGLPKPLAPGKGTSNELTNNNSTKRGGSSDHAVESDFDLLCGDAGQGEAVVGMGSNMMHEDSDIIMKDAEDHDTNPHPDRDGIVNAENDASTIETEDSIDNKGKGSQSVEIGEANTTGPAEGGTLKDSHLENDFRSEPNNHFAVSSLTSPLLDHVNSSDPHELESGREGLITPEDVQDDAQLTTATRQRTPKPVAVLNLASERSPGGGWHNGALAQEECLCYRSSLYLSLHRRYYPLPSLSAIYSPSVVLIRDAMSRGHGLLTPYELPENLPVTSVISVAALRRPPLTDDRKFYRNAGLRAETKRKIRVTIRVAALKGHTKIVLGAMGCGVFANPPKEVAECFLEVLRENEFQGGWWEEVAFAVLDNVKGPQGGKDGEGNFGVFYRVLDGQVV